MNPNCSVVEAVEAVTLNVRSVYSNADESVRLKMLAPFQLTLKKFAEPPRLANQKSRT